MAVDISAELAAILKAVYGEEVRGSIHDALNKMTVELNAAIGTQVIDRASVDNIISSEALSLKYASYEELVELTDLNALTGTPGNFWIPYNKAQTILNIPVKQSGRIFVFTAKGSGSTSDGGMQIYTSSQTGTLGIWFRGWHGTQWDEWKKAAADKDLSSFESIILDNVNKLYDDLYTQTQGSVTWYQGGLNLQGVTTDTDIRLRTTYVDTHIPYKVHVPSGLKVRIAFYTPNTAVNPHTFQFWGDWETSDFYLYENYYYAWRAMAGKESDAAIVPSEAANVLFTGIRPKALATEEYVDDEISGVNESISTVQENVNTVQQSVYTVQESINDSLYLKASINITNNYQHYWNVETSKAVYTEINAQFYASEPIPVSEGEVFTLTARQGTTDKARIWVVVNDSYDIIAMCENFNGTDLHTVTFSIPAGGTKLLLTKQQTSSVQTLYKNTSALDVLTKNLKGKYLSLLGDSISSYRGTIPEGNDVYYTGSNSGVTSPNQMWWKVLCDKTGMIPLIINGWSGSGITQLEDSAHVSKVPMSSDARCGQLDDGINTPDIILIAGGVNDYSYAMSAQSEPLDWDGKTAPVISNSFTEAYACMIKKIQTNYPNAIVVALSTWFTLRGVDNGYTLTHTVGNHVYTQQDYNDKIRYAAERMHIPYIDVSNIGFNRYNFYPTYAQDSSTIPTHPNKNGQYEMGNAIAHKLINLVAMKLMI